MGMYDYVKSKENELQIKCAGNTGRSYYLGDVIDIPDGLYIAYEGAFLVETGYITKIINEKHIFNKWGGSMELNFLDRYNCYSYDYEAMKHFGLL